MTEKKSMHLFPPSGASAAPGLPVSYTGRSFSDISPGAGETREVVTMRTELAAALRARNNAGIELAHKKIPVSPIIYTRTIRNLRVTASIDTRLGQTIDQCIGVLIRSGMVNASLNHSGIDMTRAEELVMKGKTQILTIRNLSDDGNVTGARASLSKFQKILIALRDIQNTFRAVRDIYRSILFEENLPQPAAQSVLSVAQSLDVTAAQIGTL